MLFRYFHVKKGHLLQSLALLSKERESAIAAIFSYAQSKGATAPLCTPQGVCIGLGFSDAPDLKVWKEEYGGYTPRGNTAAGKQLIQEMRALPHIPSWRESLKSVKLNDYCVEENERLYHAGLAGSLDSRVFVKLPVSSQPWVAPRSWIEIKEWQFLQFMQEKESSPKNLPLHHRELPGN